MPHPILAEKASKNTHGWSILYPAWCLLYYSVLCSLRADEENTIVETGTNNGCSTLVLATALNERNVRGRVFTFELSRERIETARELFEQTGVSDRITIVEGRSPDTIRPAIGMRPVVFAFIDSMHTVPICMGEVRALLQNVMLADGKFYFDNTECGPVDVALCKLKEEFPNGWVDFPNCSASPPGNVIWQPTSRKNPHTYVDEPGTARGVS